MVHCRIQFCAGHAQRGEKRVFLVLLSLSPFFHAHFANSHFTYYGFMANSETDSQFASAQLRPTPTLLLLYHLATCTRHLATCTWYLATCTWHLAICTWHLGIREIRNKWFASYLSNRKQYIEIDKSKSSLKSIINGVPQGSILGPVIFLVYINDMINSTSLNLLSFTDDTTIYQSGLHIDDLINNMNHELKQL